MAKNNAAIPQHKKLAMGLKPQTGGKSGSTGAKPSK